MAQKIRHIMTESPRALGAQATVEDAARAMLDDNVGDVIVSDGKIVRGIVTDRDITIRAVAHGKDPTRTTLGDICSTDLATLSPEDPINEAVRLMREHGIRRIPIVERGRPVGVVSCSAIWPSSWTSSPFSLGTCRPAWRRWPRSAFRLVI